MNREQFEIANEINKKWDRLKLYLTFFRHWVIFGVCVEAVIGMVIGVSIKYYMPETIPTSLFTIYLPILFFIFIASLFGFVLIIFITCFFIPSILIACLFYLNINWSASDSLLSASVALFIGLLVYRYTTDNNRKQLQDSLDSKSEWRKSLFQLANKDKITPGDIHVLRAALRFNFKEAEKDDLNYFDIMTKLIIKYCEGVEFSANNTHLYHPNHGGHKQFQLTYNDKIEIQTRFSPKIIRLFARYLLADHWEKNLLSNKKEAEDKLIEHMRIIDSNTLKKFFYEKEEDGNLKYNKLTDLSYLQKENELFIYTIKKFIEYSEKA
ncbi:hypothetical protein ACEE08_06490 [Staphylococcus rostri]